MHRPRCSAKFPYSLGSISPILRSVSILMRPLSGLVSACAINGAARADLAKERREIFIYLDAIILCVLPADSEQDAVWAELRNREPIFHRPELGTARVDFERMTVEDFWEVGASGRCYSRNHV